MPSLKPLPPERLRALLERVGYKVVRENGAAYAMRRPGEVKPPVMIPKGMKCVPIDVMDNVMHHANDGELRAALLDEIAQYTREEMAHGIIEDVMEKVLAPTRR